MMNWRMGGLSWIVAVAVVFGTVAARAQDWIGPTPMDYANATTSWTNTLINNAMIERMVQKRSGSSSGGRRTSAVRTRATGPAALSYTVTAAQRQRVRDAYLANLARRNPALASNLRVQLGKYDYDAVYAGLLSGTGLVNNNLADALTAYTVLGWMIVHGKTVDAPQAHVAGVRRQWLAALGGSRFARDLELRRSVAEDLKIKTVMLHSGWQSAGKTGQAAAYAEAVARSLQSQLKMDLASMRLSAAGLQRGR